MCSKISYGKTQVYILQFKWQGKNKELPTPHFNMVVTKKCIDFLVIENIIF